MKAKTIKSVLSKKIQDWADSVEDEKIKKIILNKSIVTGGAIASMLLKEKVNDFDVYFRDLESTKAVAEYYAKIFKKNSSERVNVVVDDEEKRIKFFIPSKGVAGEMPQEEDGELELEVEVDGKKYQPIFFSTNALTLSNKVQVVVRFYGEPDEIHENYDFDHCKNYWTSWNNHLELRKEALIALLSRELVYSGSKYPLCSIMRIRKFIQRGWTINAGQILKMALQLNEMDLEDLSVLEDQLTGVDAAYFSMMLDTLKEKGEEKISQGYAVSVINKMF